MKLRTCDSSPRARMSLIHIAVRALCTSGAALPFATAYADGPPPAAAQPLQVANNLDQQAGSAATVNGDNATNTTSSDQLQEVVVTGIRASLQKSMALKQESSQMLDAITAQDLGQFPDSDVADSLSHIPGVAIDRDETGAGSEVTIRGFGPAFNLVLINGQQLPTATGVPGPGQVAGGREFNFDVLPTDQITRAVVYKTSEAWQADGAIGGLIEIETAHPFDFNGPRATVKLQDSEGSIDPKATPSAFALFSDTFDDDRLGALISFSSQDQATRTRTVSTSSGWTPTTLTMLPGSPTALLPNAIDYSVNSYEIRRDNVSASLQWKPSDDVKVTLDGLYNRFEETSNTSELGLYFGGNPIVGTPTIRPDGVIESFSVDSHADNIEQQNNGEVSPQYLRSLNLKIEGESFNHQLSWAIDGSDSSNTASNYVNPSVFTVLGFPLVANYTNNGGVGIPSVTTTPADLGSDTSAGLAHYTFVGGSFTQNEIKQFTFDGTWHTDSWTPLADIRFGAYDQTNDFDSYSTYNSGDVCAFCGYTAQVPSSLLSTFQMPGNIAGPYTGSYPSSFLSYNPQPYLNFLTTSPTAAAQADAALGLKPGTTAAEIAAAGGFVPANPATNQQAISTVTEKTYALYLQGDFKGIMWEHPWGGNLGLRWVHTEDTAVGYSQVLSDITPIPNDPTGLNAIYADNGATLRLQGENSYNYLLPSSNFRFDITRQLVLRAAVSESLSRPEPSLLSPVINYGGALLAPTNLVASGGNPDLKPYTAWNYDLSLEWYYARDGYLAASVFRKDLKNFIEYLDSTLQVPIANSHNLPQFPNNVATFEFNGPTNIGQANVSGLELTAQHMFSYLPAPWDGFGVYANATIMSTSAGLNSGAASSTTQQTFGLTGLGNYQNMSLIYQKFGFEGRVTFNHRNDYIYQVGTGGQPLDKVEVKGYGTLDAQLNYYVTKSFVVSLSGTNLTDSVIQEYVNQPDEFYNLQNYGRRYTLSGKVTF
jgi:iron complex outermembrane recepter protein